jgi:hypothetical protein
MLQFLVRTTAALAFLFVAYDLGAQTRDGSVPSLLRVVLDKIARFG